MGKRERYKHNLLKFPDRIKLMFHSALFRLAFILLIIIVPICIISIIMSSTAIKMAEKQVSQDIQEALNLNMNQIDNYLKNLGKRMFTVSRSNEDYVRLLADNESENPDDVFMMHSYMRLHSVLNEIKMEYTWVDSIFVFFPQNELFISSNEYQSWDDREFLISKFSETDFEGGWKVSDTDSNELIGTFSYKDSFYGAIFKLDALLDNVNLYVSENVKLFADNATGKITDNTVLPETNVFNLEGENVTVKDTRYILQYTKSDFSGITLVELISRAQMDKSLPGFMRIFLLISIAFLISIPVIFILFWKWLVKPVNILIDAIESVDSGDLDFRIDSKTGAYEFDLLNRNFNNMLDSVQHLKIDVYEKELEKRDIRLNYLSQQIQPHFILNAMNIIYSYEPEEYDLIQKMVLCLSKYFQYIVNASRNYVQIDKELEHIENYLKIQKIRYGGKINYTVSADEAVKKAVMPPLMIQNLVENVIKYALRDDKPIEVSISALREEDNVKIVIRDTGYGMTDELIEKIRIFIETNERQEGLGIGVQNTIERMKLFFGEKAEFKACRWNNDEGTEVCLTFIMNFGED